MKIITGLGNPGLRYANTRHNAGFMVIDRLADKLGLDVTQEKFSAKYVKSKYKGEDIILLKPETFMNNSGLAVRQCLDFFKAAPEDLIIVYDDVDLPTGQLRIRPKGSAGGHNGIKSIITCVFTQQFDRVRVGISKDSRYDMPDWVLGKFSAEEHKDLDPGLDQAVEAVLDIVENGCGHAMNKYNQKKVKSENGKQNHSGTSK